MSTPIPGAPATEDKPSAAPAPPASPPPVLKATFEPASADCNGWIATGAKSIRSVPARSGSYACKLCADGSAEGIAISRDVGTLAAGRYVFAAYTRKRPQNAAPTATVATIEATTSAGAVVVNANQAAVRDEWDRLEAVIDVPDGASSLRVHIGSPIAAVDACVLIDDVSIERAP